MTAPTTPSQTTVKGHFNELCEEYNSEVLNSSLPSYDAGLQRRTRRMIVELEDLWMRLLSIGAFSANDTLDDYSTTAVEMLWAPYVIADLYQRLQGSDAPSSGVAQDGRVGSSSALTAQAPSRMANEDAARRQDQYGVESRRETAPVPQSSVVDIYSANVSARSESLNSTSRQELLARSHWWFKTFFEWMENTELTDEQTVERYSIYKRDQRTLRIELSRLCTQYKGEWSDAEGKVKYLRVKRRRMRELMEEDGEAAEEEGGEEEEVLRERALCRLRWSIYDACHQLQLSIREAEILQQTNPEQRASISASYQDTLDKVRRGELSLGRSTYTILPGGMMTAGTAQAPQALDPNVVAHGGGISSHALSAIANQHTFRQQVREDLMVDRNTPTMTLQEFAELEMADIARQMNDAEQAQARQREEDEMLGADGIEERQRKKDSAWDDWKDSNPAYGPTNKGNYA